MLNILLHKSCKKNLESNADLLAAVWLTLAIKLMVMLADVSVTSLVLICGWHSRFFSYFNLVFWSQLIMAYAKRMTIVHARDITTADWGRNVNSPVKTHQICLHRSVLEGVFKNPFKNPFHRGRFQPRPLVTQFQEPRGKNENWETCGNVADLAESYTHPHTTVCFVCILLFGSEKSPAC